MKIDSSIETQNVRKKPKSKFVAENIYFMLIFSIVKS